MNNFKPNSIKFASHYLDKKLDDVKTESGKKSKVSKFMQIIIMLFTKE